VTFRGTNDGGDLAIPATGAYLEFGTLVHRRCHDTAMGRLQRAGDAAAARRVQLTVPAYFAVPVAEPPRTRVVVVHEAPHITSPTEGSVTGYRSLADPFELRVDLRAPPSPVSAPASRAAVHSLICEW